MPGWPTLVEQIKLAEATPVIVRTHAEEGFRLRADTILAAITPRTRGIVINSPGNPTGALIGRRPRWRELADEAAPRGIWILLDLCYERLIYDTVAAQPARGCWWRGCATARCSADRRRRRTR